MDKKTFRGKRSSAVHYHQRFTGVSQQLSEIGSTEEQNSPAVSQFVLLCKTTKRDNQSQRSQAGATNSDNLRVKMAPEADTHIEIKTSRSPHSKGGNKGGSLPLYRKLLLAATMTGNETCVSFQQLYEVPLLQILGVPVALISLYPIVTGPVAMVMLAVLGYCSDKGSNHRQKKVGVVVLNTILTLCGVSLVIMANVMLLTSAGNTDDPVSLADKNVTFGPLENITVASSLITLPATTTIPTANMTSAEPLQTEAEEPGLFSLPTTAVLGVLGFCLMDVGYDANIGSTRSCMLACSPAADHTSIFVLALVMAAVGGCINCGLGLVDLSHALDFGSGEG